MSQGLEIRSQVAMAGRVVLAAPPAERPKRRDTPAPATAVGIPGCQVDISQAPPDFLDKVKIHHQQFGSRWDTMPQRIDRTQTAADGLFYFMDLPKGNYTLIVSALDQGTRFGTGTGTPRVDRDKEGKITFQRIEITLPATTIAGQVTGPDKKPIPYAQLRLQGSREQTLSDKQGNFRLVGVEASPRARTLVASARGFKTLDKTVTCEQGKTKQLTLTMAKL